ncbi:MAG: aldehyde dehydrogenase [Deltaproteobacteria bacterium]|nr:aldehyde dehydrogenase [Deltaproteobacteria bacterium]
MDQATIDRAVARVADNKTKWARLPLRRKIGYLERCLEGTVNVANRQVAAALAAKGIDPTSPTAGEEWLGGPLVTVRNIRLLIETLRAVEEHGHPPLERQAISQRPDGQVVVEVFPQNGFDKLLYRGFSAHVWQAPHIKPSDLPTKMAGFYAQSDPQGAVALVLGAGNVASIGPLDVIYKLFAEGQVCVLKLNPVNEYLGPHVEKAFSALVEDGFLSFAYGGPEVGAYLCQHPGIDEIHITGSDRTHDAIVFGSGPEQAQRKREKRPINTRRITSELGNVSPVIIAPGEWSLAELRFQAENVATQMTNNAGFNCNAAKVLVTSKMWAQREQFLEALRDVLARLPRRQAYYPGALERFDNFVGVHSGQAELFGERSGRELPWALIAGLDPAKRDDVCFTQESFCGVTAEAALDAGDPAQFLADAVAFCNETLWGTLNASLIVDPRTEKEYEVAVEQAVADLRYGSVAVNHWPALSYGLGVTTWGAFPGHSLEDIQSGVGVVHNCLLFDEPQKSVVRGPFRIAPRPPWFVTHRRTHKLAPVLMRFEARPGLRWLPTILANALRG